VPSFLRRLFTLTFLCSAASLIVSGTVVLAAEQPTPALSSDFLRELVTPPGEELDLDACETWNPEFAGNSMRCCGRLHDSRAQPRCDVHRNRANYCSEITDDEREYVEAVKSGKIGDVLEFLTAQTQHRQLQAMCTVNSGFLVRGRPIVPTAENVIKIRSPDRCTNYGTDPMVAMLEYLGRKIKKEFQPEYPGIRFLLGDVTAPRGGCLASSGGRRGHKSHSTGQDADIGFITPIKNGPSPDSLHKNLQPKPNWWFLKQLFHNPFACIRVIFLDHRQINKIARVAYGDPDWQTIRKFLRHIKGHQNHFHVRIGDGPGQPGCVANANPDEELRMEFENGDEGDTDSEPSGSGAGESPEVD
jgi:murein endopeptidase